MSSLVAGSHLAIVQAQSRRRIATPTRQSQGGAALTAAPAAAAPHRVMANSSRARACAQERLQFFGSLEAK